MQKQRKDLIFSDLNGLTVAQICCVIKCSLYVVLPSAKCVLK